MRELHWSSTFIGIAYADRGRSRAGADCWGLARIVYAEKLGVDLPSYVEDYPSSSASQPIAGLVGRVSSLPVWEKVAGVPQPFDILVFRNGRHDSHIGIAADRGLMLHMVEGDQARLENFSGGRWASRFVAAYRYRDGAARRPHLPSGSIEVMAGGPFRDPTEGADHVLPPGMTIAEIVATVMPGIHGGMLDKVEVLLEVGAASTPVLRAAWSRVRPRDGVRVRVTLAPGSDKLRGILSVVVSIAALAVGSLMAPWLAANVGIFGASTWQSIAGLGTLVIGTLAINALVPAPQAPEARSPKPNYQISSWRNPISPDGVVPSVLGKRRYAPPFATLPHSRIKDGKQYISAVFCFGYGPVAIYGERIGQTPLDDFTGVTRQARMGEEDDTPIRLVDVQVMTEQIGTELTCPYPRNDRGEIISGPPAPVPVKRQLATDCKRARIIVSFPQGLVKISDKGEEKSAFVEIRMRSRPVGETDWTITRTAKVYATSRDPFFREFSWSLSSRGDHEVQVARLTPESTNAQRMDRVQLVEIQGIRPEYWDNFGKPLALVALRIKASLQLSGGLDSYNALVSRICPDWDYEDEAWVTRETRNPASLYRRALQGPENAEPTPDDEIDLDALADWHDFCRLKGLSYDEVHDFAGSKEDTLVRLAAAGRASPRHDGSKWTVVIDRPKTLVVDEFNARNSHSFRWNHTYSKPPHAFRIPFLDRTNGYQAAERLVHRPGFDPANITITEQLDLPGKTDPVEIWIEGRRKWHEARYRADTYQLIVDSMTRPAVRGDLVMLNHDVLARVTKAARVVAVEGDLVVLDDVIEMEFGTVYAIRFRWYADDEDAVGESVVRQVQTFAGEHRCVWVSDASRLPDVGAIVHFGPLVEESLPCIVKSVEAGENMSAVYTLIAASDDIDDATDAEVPPPWSPRVGQELSLPGEPGQPVFTRILSGRATEDENGLIVYVVDDDDTEVDAVEFDIDHRLFGAPTWTTVTVDAGTGGVEITGYANGDTVQLRARGRAEDGTNGAYNDTVSVVIGQDDGAVPAELPEESITVEGGMGSAQVDFVTGDDEATVRVKIYRNASTDPGDLDRVADLVDELIVLPNRAYSVVDGDNSRVNLMKNPSFASSKGWTVGTGWSIFDGVATHVAGATGGLARAVSLTAAKTYRLKFDASDVTGGAVTPRLTGGTTVFGSAVSADGMALDAMTALSGNANFQLNGDDDFAGDIDDIVLFQQTAACLSQGTHVYWLEPENAAGVPGTLSGPFSVTVI